MESGVIRTGKYLQRRLAIVLLLLSGTIYSLPDERATAYDQGVAFEKAKEWERAFAFFHISSLQGDIAGKVMLGICYQSGMGTKRNYEAAFRLFQEAAEKGDSIGAYNSAVAYENGYGTKRDLNQAFFWYQRSAERGDLESMFQLGRCFYDGAGTEKNDDKALNWIRKAARGNDPQALNFLGTHAFEKGEMKKAFQYFQQSAGAGLPEAQYHLGLCYEEGNGVGKSLSSAIQWFEKAAAQDEVPALQKMADFHLRGIGVAKDEAKAASQKQRADQLIQHEKQRPEDFSEFMKNVHRETEAGDKGKALKQIEWLCREWSEYNSWLDELPRWRRLFEASPPATEFLKQAGRKLKSQILAGDCSTRNIRGVLEINRILGNEHDSIEFYREFFKKNPQKAKQYWTDDYLLLFIDKGEYEIPEKLTDVDRKFNLQAKIYRSLASRKQETATSRENFGKIVSALTKLLRKYNKHQEADELEEKFRAIINQQ